MDNNGWKSIHIICRYSAPELIKYIIDKGADIKCSTCDGSKPIDLINGRNDININIKNEYIALFNL